MSVTSSTPSAPTASPNTSATTKQSWHATIDLAARRSVLLHILVLLKAKYGRMDPKISYIGRRAELALYSQAFSAWEYRNPQTLSRRLHSLVVKLHLNNLAEKENVAFAAQQAILLTPDAAHTASNRKRKSDALVDPETLIGKRLRLDTTAQPSASALFFDGNTDLLQHVCSFLDATDVLRCAATCSQASSQLPAFVTTIEVTTSALQTLSVAQQSRFFQRFPNLQCFSLTGEMHVQQFDFQDETTLIARNLLVRNVIQALRAAQLPRLEVFALTRCYSEGLQDQITDEVARVLAGPASRFPRLRSLTLEGNCISDDGVIALYDALALALPRRANSTVLELDLANNFVGERGVVRMQELVMLFAVNGAELAVDVRGNLLTPPAPVATSSA